VLSRPAKKPPPQPWDSAAKTAVGHATRGSSGALTVTEPRSFSSADVPMKVDMLPEAKPFDTVSE
jgi:hypothetical protein